MTNIKPDIQALIFNAFTAGAECAESQHGGAYCQLSVRDEYIREENARYLETTLSAMSSETQTKDVDLLGSKQDGEVRGEYIPSIWEIERAWVLRQGQLDEEAGHETDGLAYSQEFRKAIKAHDREAAEKVWHDCLKHVSYEIRAIPSCGNGQGGQMFDLLPLGPDESSESGARIAVFEVLDGITSPYRKPTDSHNEGELILKQYGRAQIMPLKPPNVDQDLSDLTVLRSLVAEATHVSRREQRKRIRLSRRKKKH